MATTRVRWIHIHLQDMELACQIAGQQVAGNAAAGAIHHPELSTLTAFLQRRQVQAVAGKDRIGLVAPEQFTGTLFDRRQHSQLIGARNPWLRTS